MRKTQIPLFLILITSFSPVCLADVPASVFSAPAKIEDSVIMISVVKQDLDYVTPWKQTSMSRGVGSGLVISGNRILTNAHNVADQKYIEVKKQDSAQRYPAIVEFVGHDCDLAVLKVADPHFFDTCPALEIGDLPEIHSTVRTYGFPVGGRRVSVTEGVVSRIQTSNYSHTQFDAHLVIQTDAAINPGNSGGPVVQNGKVVGVAFQGLRSADNIGYLIPTTVIRHFLNDIEDGTYDGFGSLGFTMYDGMHNKSYADYLKAPAGIEGVIVLSTVMHSSVENLLQKGDVVTRIEDYDIDNDGMIDIYGLKISLSEVIEQKQIGEKVRLTYYRGGEQQTLLATVALNRGILDYSKQFDIAPRYEVYAGLTFVPLTRNYLETWGAEWLNDVPFYLRYLFFDSIQLNEDRDRKEYVVLSEILEDEVNVYASGFKDSVVDSVNGITIHKLDDLQSAFAQSDDGFCTIRFMGTNTPLILDNEKAKQRHKMILEKYDVPAERSL